MRRATLLTVLLLAASLGSAAAQVPAPASGTAATRTVLLLTDPAGDQVVTSDLAPVPNCPSAGSPTCPPSYANVDLTAVLARQAAAGTPSDVTLIANFSATPTATQSVSFLFQIGKGPDSAPASTASGAPLNVTVTGTTVAGAAGATATASNDQLLLTLPYAGIGAAPGDVLTLVSVTARDQHAGPAGNQPAPVPQGSSSGTDHAPKAGAARPFTLQPPPFASDLAAAVVGGQITESNGTRAFAGSAVATRDGNATVRFDVRVTNLARGPDTVRLTAPGASPSLQFTLPDAVGLAPGANATLPVTLRLRSAAPATVSPTFRAEGVQGEALAPATLTILPPAPPGHHAIPAALKFLTPLVTDLGLDRALGNYAELAFLLLLVLVAVALVFLALFLVQTPWLRVAVEPRRALASPGGVAEFRVRLDQARRGVASARAVLRRAPWAAAFRFRGATAEAGGGAGAGMAGTVQLDPANPAEGVLRVEVPPGTPSLERETVEFDIVPLDAAGGEMPRHRARGHVTVQALQSAASDPKVPKARDIRLAAVRHEPPDPLPGGTVTTTATIHNDGSAPAALRLVLLLDGRPVVEERVEVAARSTREVGLPWSAGAGKNQVKVQVFLA